MNRATLMLVALALLLVGVAQSRAGNIIYDPAAAFSTTNNPNGVWSYGWSHTLGSAFIPDTDFVLSSGLSAWLGDQSADGTPGIAYNGTGSPISIPGTIVTYPTGGLAEHPGPAGQDALLRFTAPSSGNYSIAGNFSGFDRAPTTTDVHVLVDGVSEFDGNVGGYGPSSAVPFLIDLPLKTGDIIDFAVGVGSDGSNHNDTTGLAATITEFGTGTTPEPASLTLLGIGAVGALGYAWRRRKQTTMYRATLMLVVLALLLSGVGQSRAGNIIYDPAAAFSTTNNPNGVWSYGWSQTLGSAFILDTGFVQSNGLSFWQGDQSPEGDGTPEIFHNGTGSPINPPGTNITVPAGALGEHPGPAGQDALLLFMAPSSGDYSIAGNFSGFDRQPTTTDVHVLVDGVSMFNGAVNTSGPGSAVPFLIDLPLKAGDTVDFAVGFGSDGNYYNDATGLAATITEFGTGTTPEPASLTLLGIGAVCSLGYAWRRRSRRREQKGQKKRGVTASRVHSIRAVEQHEICLAFFRRAGRPFIPPKTTIHFHRRIVDNGRVVCSAVIAAGIDMSLHVSARLLGMQVPEQTARQMEYAGEASA